MKQHWTEKAIFAVASLPVIPLSVGEKLESKLLRALCLLWFVPWCLITGIPLLPVILLLTLCDAFVDFVWGDVR